MRTYTPSTLTLALSAAADQVLSAALQPAAPGASAYAPAALRASPRGCRQLNKHSEALRSVKSLDRLPAPGGAGALMVPGAGASARSSTRSISSLTADDALCPADSNS